MAAIANVALTNTFDSWRSRSNQSFTRLNQFAVNESSLYANTLTANVAFVSKGLATMQGKATVGTNLVVTANTTTNKLTVTSNLAASGNVQLGDASTDIVNIRGKGNTFASFIVGENLTVSGNTSAGVLTVTSANVAIAAASANPALRITQTGTGLALIVEDSASPDTTPVVITTSGNLGVGTRTPTYPIDTTGVIRTTSTAGIYSNQLLLQHDGTNAFVRPTNAGGLYLGSNNQTRISISSAGLTTVNQSLTVGKNLIVTGNTTLGDSGAADKVTINGGTTLNHSLSIGNNLTVSGNTTLGNSASADKVTITGGVTLNQSLAISKNLTVTGNNAFSGISAFSGTINSAGANILSQTLTDGATITWNTALGQIATVTLGGNRTMADRKSVV